MIEFLYDYKVYITILIIYIIHKIGQIGFNLNDRFNITGPKPLPYFGNLIQIGRQGPRDFDTECVKKYGNVFSMYLGASGMVVIKDPLALKHILVKDFRCFADRFDLDLDNDTKSFLTRLKGKDWERVRDIVTPTFTSGKLKKMSPLISDCVKMLMDNLEKSSEGDKEVDVKELFGALTMDAISRTMFGMEVDTQKNPNNIFVVKAKKLFSFSLLQPFLVIILLFPRFSKLLNAVSLIKTVMSADSLIFFKKTVQEVIKQRKSSNEEFNDFLDIMLKKEENENSKSDEKRLSVDEIVAQAVIFLLAGYETTANSITFFTYFMAMNPDQQEEVFNEISNVVGTQASNLKYEAIQKLPLLDAAINESMRLVSPAVQVNRLCTEDVRIPLSDGRILQFKNGDTVVVPINAIHHDAELWPEPEKFDMHRFDADNKGSIDTVSFLPFGFGPRNCVGMRFALLEMKWAIVNMMLKFEFAPGSDTPKVLEFKKSGLTAAAKPIMLRLIERS